MDIPVQRVPLDSGPPLPKPGGTHAMGTDRDMRYSSGLADKRAHHPSNQERVDQELLETIDNQGTGVLGYVHLRASAATSGSCSSSPSSHNHVDDREPRSEPTTTPASSLVDGSELSSSLTSPRGHPTWPNDGFRIQFVHDVDLGRPSNNTREVHLCNSTKASRPTQSTSWPLPDDESTSIMHRLEAKTFSQVTLTTLRRLLLHEYRVCSLYNHQHAARPALDHLAGKDAGPAHTAPSFFRQVLLGQLLARVLSFLHWPYAIMSFLLETESALVGTSLRILDHLAFFMITIGEDIQDPGYWTDVDTLQYRGNNVSPKILIAGHLCRREGLDGGGTGNKSGLGMESTQIIGVTTQGTCRSRQADRKTSSNAGCHFQLLARWKMFLQHEVVMLE